MASLSSRPKRVTKPTKLKNFGMLGHMPVDAALAELQSPMWMEDTYLRDYPQGPFGDTESVILRFSAARFEPPIGCEPQNEREQLMLNYVLQLNQHENIFLPIADQLPICKELVFMLAKHVHATRIGRVMINKLKPGGHITRHADSPVHAQYWSRFHIVLQGDKGAKFYCGNDGEEEMVNMQTGEVWFFKNELPHEVQNDSERDRINMVVDLKTEMK